MTKLNVWKQFTSEVERGRKGLNVGLDTGFDRLSEYICNIQRGRYDLIGGATGTGKTALVDSAYVFHPVEHYMNIKNTEEADNYKLNIIYFSLEIDPVVKLGKLVSRKIWEDYNALVNVNYVFSRGKNRISEDIYQLVMSYKDYFEDLMEIIDFHSSLSPLYLHKVIKDAAESQGKISYVVDDDGKKTRVVKSYEPTHHNQFTLIVIDHVGLIGKNSQDKSKKEAIDRASHMLVNARNNFGFSPVVVSQFNRGIEGMDRRENNAIEPQLSDFKETGSTQEDANTVIGLFYPYRYGVDTHRGYPIDKIARYYRSLHVLKNRDGSDSMFIGMYFMGAIGKFKELPKAEDLNSNPEMLRKILTYHKKKPNQKIEI